MKTLKTTGSMVQDKTRVSASLAKRLTNLLLAILCLAGIPLAANAAPSAAKIPSRIVLGGKAVVMVADAVYLFPGVRDHLVAVAAADQGLGIFLAAIDPGFSARTVLDRAAGVETYAALKPDLVILKSTMRKALETGLSRLGIPQIYLDLEKPEDYFSELMVLGEAFSDIPRATALINYYRDELGRVSARLSTLKVPFRPRVLLLQASSQGGGTWEVPPASWMQTILVETAGGIPVWKDANPGSGWARVGIEQILAWNPDQIHIVSYKEDSRTLAASFQSDSRFASLKAVRLGQIAAFPQDFYSWDQPDTRWILGLQWMAKKMYPQLFSDVSIMERAERFFSFGYGMDVSTFRSLIAPRLVKDLAE